MLDVIMNDPYKSTGWTIGPLFATQRQFVRRSLATIRERDGSPSIEDPICRTFHLARSGQRWVDLRLDAYGNALGRRWNQNCDR